MNREPKVGTFVRVKSDHNKSVVGKIVNIHRIVNEYENRDGLLDRVKTLRKVDYITYIIRLSDNKIVTKTNYEFDIITKQEYFLEAI
jgi:hypothetical protein